jgi:CheY-like chemotaxis protein
MKTILLAEDDAFTREVYRLGLVREGFQVEVAADGVAAAKMLNRISPDLVLLDLIMPKLSALEVLKFIRSDSRFKATPVVVFTSSGRAAEVEPLNRYGVQWAVSKSEYSPPKLAALLREILADSAGSGVSGDPGRRGKGEQA